MLHFLKMTIQLAQSFCNIHHMMLRPRRWWSPPDFY